MKLIYIFSILTLAILATGCKKDGEPEYAPGFGSLRILSNTIASGAETRYLLQMDDKTIDTIKSTSSFDRAFTMETGKRIITLKAGNGAEVFRDTVEVTLQGSYTLPAFVIGDNGLIPDDYDPNVITPAPGKCLVRLMLTDPALPDLMNITIVCRNATANPNGGELVVTAAEFRNVSKTGFTDYLEIASPEMLAGLPNSSATNSYLMLGYNAATGEQILSGTGTKYFARLRFTLEGSNIFLGDNVISVAVPPLSPPVSVRSSLVLFQTKL